MLDIVAAQKDELALAVEVEHVDDAKAGLPRPIRQAGQLQAAPGQGAQQQARDQHQGQNERQREDGLHARREFIESKHGPSVLAKSAAGTGNALAMANSYHFPTLCEIMVTLRLNLAAPKPQSLTVH